MRKLIFRLEICCLLAVLFFLGTLISDRQRLGQELIRLHVVAASDSAYDQALKLRVRDAVTRSLCAELENLGNAELAREYLKEKLPYIQNIARDTLQQLGCEDSVAVSLCREVFDKRVYDTFTLPAGVYQSLRIVIGEGAGKNWWCVVFPSFCTPLASDTMEDVAAGAGFPDSLTASLTGEEGYEVRFALLEGLGKLENILFAG